MTIRGGSGALALCVLLASAAPAVAQLSDPAIPQTESRPNRGRGALWGAGIGLVAGGLLGALTLESDGDGDIGSGLADAAATGEALVFGALVGAGIGALLGATVFAPSRSPADERALRLTPTVGWDRVGLRARIRWGPGGSQPSMKTRRPAAR